MKRIAAVITIVLFTLADACPAFSTNLISNWGFEDGYTDFWTDYTTGKYALDHEGGYAVGYHASPDYRSDSVFDNAYPYQGSNFFMANGSSDTTDVVWQTTSVISVAAAGTVYRFEAYVCTLLTVSSSTQMPSLSFQLCDEYGNYIVLSTVTKGYNYSGGVWYLVYADGVFDAAGNYYLRLVNNQSAAYGNDFGVDSIYFGFASEAPTVTAYPVTTYGSYSSSSLDSVPNINTAKTYYTVSELVSDDVGSTFDGGILMEDTGGRTLNNVFTVLSTNGKIDTNGYDLAISGDMTGAGSIEKIGTGTLTLSGAASNTGGIIVSAGTIILTGANTYTGDTTINSGGTLRLGNGGTTGSLSTGSAIANNGTLSFNRSNTVTQGVDFASSISGSGNLNQLGTGTLVLSGTNTYTGATIVGAGTLALSGGSAIADTGAVILGDVSGATLRLDSDETIGSLSGGGSAGGNIDLQANALTTGDSTDTVFSGIISGAGGSIIKQGTGTLTLYAANTYSGGTQINNGTILLMNNSALGTGALTNNATLDLGNSELSLGGAYIQSAGSTLKLALNSLSDFGSITSASAAAVDADSTISVTVGSYIPDNAEITIVNTGGSGIGDVPGTVISSNRHLTFTAVNSGGNLILMANRSGSGFRGDAGNANSAAIGRVLDTVTDPTPDMSAILNILENLSADQVASAEETMSPTGDRGHDQYL